MKKFTKQYRSWMGRAEALQKWVERDGWKIEWTQDSFVVVGTPPIRKKPWWRFWGKR